MYLNSFVFWRHIIEEQEGVERDGKLEELYKGIIISNLFMFSLTILMGYLFVHVTTIYLSPAIIFVLLAFLICITHYQFTTCRDAIKRNIDNYWFEYYKGEEEEYSESKEEETSWDDDDTDEEDTYYMEEELDSDNIRTLYDKYNLPYDADSQTVKKRFRMLAKEFHPDTPTGDSEKFINLKDDIDIISNYIKEERIH